MLTISNILLEACTDFLALCLSDMYTTLLIPCVCVCSIDNIFTSTNTLHLSPSHPSISNPHTSLDNELGTLVTRKHGSVNSATFDVMRILIHYGIHFCMAY